jgi:hypothetical protein
MSTEAGRGTKAESRSRVTRQPPKERKVVDPEADLVGQRALLKTELSHCAGGGADQTEFQLRATHLSPGENNSSDHTA